MTLSHEKKAGAQTRVLSSIKQKIFRKEKAGIQPKRCSHRVSSNKLTPHIFPCHIECSCSREVVRFDIFILIVDLIRHQIYTGAIVSCQECIYIYTYQKLNINLKCFCDDQIVLFSFVVALFSFSLSLGHFNWLQECLYLKLWRTIY